MSDAAHLKYSPEKSTPLQLREQYNLSISRLAEMAKVDSTIIYRLLLGKPIERREAEKILKMISLMTEVSYDLENVHVVLTTESVDDTSSAAQEKYKQ